jgi:DNA-binding NtrC family response regulator
MPTILLIENDRAIRQLYKEILIKNGYEVIASRNCDKIIQLIKLNHIDAILIDHDIKCLKDIRQLYPTSKIIMLTGDSRIKSKKAQTWGIRVRVKPIKVSELVTEINNLIAISKMDAETQSDEILETLSQTSGRNRIKVQNSQEILDTK